MVVVVISVVLIRIKLIGEQPWPLRRFPGATRFQNRHGASASCICDFVWPCICELETPATCKAYAASCVQRKCLLVSAAECTILNITVAKKMAIVAVLFAIAVVVTRSEVDMICISI